MQDHKGKKKRFGSSVVRRLHSPSEVCFVIVSDIILCLIHFCLLLKPLPPHFQFKMKAGTRICSAQRCFHVVPPKSVYEFTTCETCRMRGRSNREKRKHRKQEGLLPTTKTADAGRVRLTIKLPKRQRECWVFDYFFSSFFETK